MNYPTIIIIALGLSMDAFAVSMSEGLTLHRQRIQIALKLALFFGVFQALMPVIGWLAGMSLKNYIAAIDHWIAFGLLTLVGAKMIYEAAIERKARQQDTSLTLLTIFILAVATSIDALAIGITFSFIKVAILTPVLIIGLITFVASLIGYFLGERFAHLLGSKVEAAGGFILIIIGLKILFGHI
jgi:putative Mn2+ efflux pump MntP